MLTSEPTSTPLKDLAVLIHKCDIYLHSTKRWIGWGPSGAGVFDAEKIPYDAKMKFVFKKISERK